VLVLVDECLPERLSGLLRGERSELEVRTAREAGLAGKKDGIVIDFACAYFDVLVTVGAGLPAEQAARRRNLRVVVLAASAYGFAALAPLVPALAEALASIGPGQVVRLPA
jgi:predicted nuclease of predicted toxin-antitoxin system